MKVPYASKIDPVLKKAIKELSDETRIAQAKLLEEALEDLFKKHNKKIKK